MICSLCEQPIESTATAYQRVTGWVKKRKGGGANQITMREELDEWAHEHCIDRAKADVDVIPGQLSIA